MWNETVARAIVAERLAAADKAAHFRRLSARSDQRRARSSRHQRWIDLPIYSAARRINSTGSAPA